MIFSRTRYEGSVYLRPGQVVWLIAEQDGPPVDGGIEPTPETVFPPPPESLTKLLGQRGVDWSMIAPLAARASLLRFPNVSDRELGQGAQWQAEKVLRMGDLDPTYDFEPWDVDPLGSRPTVVLGVRSGTMKHWREWLSRLNRPIARFEPAISANARGIVAVSRTYPGYQRPLCYLSNDGGSTSIVIAQHGVPLTVRSLLPATRRDSPSPLSGELGIRAVRETLLSCEDRFPRLEIEGLVGLGDLDPTWLDEVSGASHLPLVEAPAPPVPWPTPLHEPNALACWPTLLGAVHGFRALTPEAQS